MTVSFDTTGDTVVVKTTVTVTVATKEDADAAIANGDTSVVTEETKAAVQKENKAKANDNAVESKPTPTQSNSSKKNDSSSGNSNSGNNGHHNGNSGNNGNTSNGNHNGNTNGNGNNNGSGNNGSTDKPQQHTHKYVEVSRTNATCTAAGSITKKCSCGDVITVPNGDALGHDPITKTDKGHYVHTVIKAAWNEDIWESRYICNGCGATFTHDYDAIEHIAESGVNGTCHNYYAKSVKVNTIHHPEQATDEWVVDPYTVCSRCGQQL